VREEPRVRRAPVIPGESNPPVMVVPVQPPVPAPQSARAPESPPASVAASPPPPPSAGVDMQADAREAAGNAALLEESVVSAERADEAKRETRDKSQLARDRASLSGASAASHQLAMPNPAVWLENIRQLRRDGKVLQADREWMRFRKVFPDYPVADDDVARVPGPR
jgi:hypothetical protein